MMPRPELSIVTITCNDPVGLAATLHSLRPLATSQISWEHVVVDSSPEQTEAVVASVDGAWPLRRITTERDGIYAALNAGIRHSTGEIIWLLNGGDRLRDLAVLSRLLETMQRQKLDIVCAGADLFRHGEFLYAQFPRRTFRGSLLGSNRICQQGVLYRAESVRAVGEFKTTYRIAGDYEFHLRCLAAGLRASCADERLVSYDMDGLSSTNWRQTLDEIDAVLDALSDTLPPTFVWPARVAARLERLRLVAIKRAASSPFETLLRPAWVAWNRRRAARRTTSRTDLQ